MLPTSLIRAHALASVTQIAAEAGVRLQHVAWPRREDMFRDLGDVRNEIIGKDVHG